MLGLPEPVEGDASDEVVDGADEAGEGTLGDELKGVARFLRRCWSFDQFRVTAAYPPW
jgi:hypothetical protein